MNRQAGVTKEMRFEAAHIVTGYNGACANLHGHSYKVHVTVPGEIKEDGMVLDFKDLKGAMKKIIDKMDHAFIYNTDVVAGTFESAVLAAAMHHSRKVYGMKGAPTAENMACLIAESIAQELGFNLVGVKIWETETSHAEVIYEG